MALGWDGVSQKDLQVRRNPLETKGVRRKEVKMRKISKKESQRLNALKDRGKTPRRVRRKERKSQEPAAAPTVNRDARRGGDCSPQSLAAPPPLASVSWATPVNKNGGRRERSPVADVFPSPERFTNRSPVDSAALRKRAAVSLVFFSHGAEIEMYFPQSLLLPAPAAHSPLSGVGRGRRGIRGRGRGRGRRGIRGVLRVRDAGFGGVPYPHPHALSPFSRCGALLLGRQLPHHAPLRSPRALAVRGASPDRSEAPAPFFPFPHRLPAFISTCLLFWSLAHWVS